MGFPIDLTEIMAEEFGFTVDHKGFEEELHMAKEKSKQSSKFKQSQVGGDLLIKKLEAKHTDLLEKQGVLPTIEESRYEWHTDIDSTIVAIYDGASENLHQFH